MREVRLNREILEQALAVVRDRLPSIRAESAVILGSGWSKAADDLPPGQSVDYADIPGLGTPGIEGHPGRLSFANIEGIPVLLFHGRRHWYEGVGWESVILPVYLATELGCSSVILTNAAGAINPDFRPGDIMVLDDHINGMGSNPLIGPHHPTWGPRFPDQSHVYSPLLRRLIDESAAELSISVRHGVYVALPGPAFETPAEIRALRALGADAVGMSTVPEAMLAHAAGQRVVALSCIANMAAGIGSQILSHNDVIATLHDNAPRLSALLLRAIAKISSLNPRKP